MLSTLLSALLLLPAAARSESPWFSEQCPQAFQALADRNDLAVRAAAIRARVLRRQKMETPLKYRVGDDLYTVTHQLGNSTAMVYLGKSPTGKTVVIKLYGGRYSGLDKDAVERLVRDEWAKSEVLSALPGGPPKVLAVDLKRGVVVKEYMSGFSIDGLGSYIEELGLTREQEQQIRLELGAAGNRWAAQRAELNRKIREKFVSLGPPPGETVAAMGPFPLDNKSSNFMYSFARKSWVFFDP